MHVQSKAGCVSEVNCVPQLCAASSPRGNSPWRTHEAGQSSHTGCLPPPLSCTSHSDWDPCRISEIISDRRVSPSLISAWDEGMKNKYPGRDGASRGACVPPQKTCVSVCPPAASLGVSSSCSEPVKSHLLVFIRRREPMGAGLGRLVPPQHHQEAGRSLQDCAPPRMLGLLTLQD